MCVDWTALFGPYEIENVRKWRDIVLFVIRLHMFPMRTTKLSSEGGLLRVQNRMGSLARPLGLSPLRELILYLYIYKCIFCAIIL